MVSLQQLNHLSEIHRQDFSAPPTSIPIDPTKFWGPETLGSLYYLPSYQTLTPQEKLKYNQFFALSICEQFVWFEEYFICPILKNMIEAVKKKDIDNTWSLALTHFYNEEVGHSELFWRLLQNSRPDLYPQKKTFLFQPSWLHQLILKKMIQNPNIILSWIWLSILFEERTLDFSRRYLEDQKQIDPQFVRAHKMHMIDEARHVQMDYHLVERFYKSAPAWQKKLTVFFMNQVVESYASPSRVPMKILRQMQKELPSMTEEKILSFQQELPSLKTNEAFLKSAFGPRATRRTYELLLDYNEFSSITQFLKPLHEV